MSPARPVVLHVVPSFTGGGTERQLTMLTSALVAAGAEVHLAYLREGPNFAEVRSSGADLHPITVRSSYDPAAITQLRALLRKVRPMVVQTWLLHADVSAGLAALWTGVPWILSERSSRGFYAAGGKFRIRSWLGRYADMVIANSNAGANYWRGAGFRGAVEVVRNIVPPRPHSGLPGAAAAGAARRVVAIGRLSEEKNYPALLAALETMLSGRPDVRVDVLGEGHLRAMLQRQIDGSATLAGRVRLVGFVDDVPERLHQAAVFVSMSRFEGTANAQLDALQARCPMVLSDIEAHRELVDNDAALFTPPDDAPAMAAAISRCLDDPSASRAMAERARARLQLDDWTPERIARRYLDLYSELASRRGK